MNCYFKKHWETPDVVTLVDALGILWLAFRFRRDTLRHERKNREFFEFARDLEMEVIELTPDGIRKAQGRSYDGEVCDDPNCSVHGTVH